MKRLAAMIFGFVLIGTMMTSMIDAQTLPPKKQMANGVSAEDVICKGGYTLMIRMGGNAACVTPSTATKLSAAGWGEIIKEFEVQTEPKDEEVTLNEEVASDDDESSGEEESESKKIELRESMPLTGG